MSYTVDDYISIKNAVLALARGERVVEATFEGESVQYAQADLTKLRDLQREIAADLRAQKSARTGVRYVTQSGRGY